jgi:hypothetical protein
MISSEVKALRQAILALELASRYEGIGVAVIAPDQTERHRGVQYAERKLLDLVGAGK